MTPSPRTPQLRDRRLARVRLLANTIFLASSALSAGMVAYFASTSHASTTPNTVPSTTTPTTAGGPGATTPPTTQPTHGGGGGGGGTTVTTRPVAPTTIATVPVSTPTTCHTSASGTFLGCW